MESITQDTHEPVKKKPYKTPDLIEHGTVEKITSQADADSPIRDGD